ncbi:MAG TPA: DNA primase [Verrucomicrobiae bacterium]|jgi:DNA primase|nr:DNA primase [Verrucomicrobiae bacterium]
MGGIISPSTVEQIRSASDIVDVIGGYIPLKRAGANFVALCPFHKEKTPSFNVNPQKQIFHCFGCHKGGDVFTFVKEFESIDFPDAVRRLAERARIPIETDNQPGVSETRHLKDRLFQIHEQITQRWQSALAAGEPGQIARDYLARRGVSAEAVELFRLGYAPDAWDDTVNWAKSKQHELALVEQAGLILRKENTDHFYDRFRGRLIFPICDDQGRVVGFSGRILTGDEKTAKYVNSPETAIFTKGKVMFGLDKSKRAISDEGFAIICEGQLDLIACYMAGVKNVVAPQGTALTADHTRILKRYADEVVLCFDSDNAGQNAAVRSLDIVLSSSLAVRVATVPSPHDPDSFIKEFGGAAFSELIKSARGFFDYYLDRLCVLNDPASDRGRKAIVQSMAEALFKAGSDVLRDTYAQKTALRLGVAADAMRSEFKKGARAKIAETGDAEEVAPVLERPSPPECWLLRVLLEREEYVEWVEAHLELNWLPSPTAREIIKRRLEMADAWPGVAAWLGELENPEWKTLITEILANPRPIHDAEGNLKGSPTCKGALTKFRDEFIEQQLASLRQGLDKDGLSEAEQQELLSAKQHLLRLKQTKLTPKSDQA